MHQAPAKPYRTGLIGFRFAHAIGRAAKRSTVSAVITTCALLATPVQQTAAQAGPTSPQAFAAAYVAAIRNQDWSRRKALYHPSVLACINNADRRYFDQGIADELKMGETLAPGFTITSLRPVPGRALLGMLPADGFYFPVKPTMQMQIDAKDKGHNSVILFHYLAKAGDRWYTVDPCPNAKGMLYFARQTAERQRQLIEGAKLEAAMPQALRQQMRGLIAGGRWIDALDAYRHATGADMRKAVMVVDAMRAGR